MASVELAATESRSVSRSELVAYVNELSEWLQTEHQLTLRKACICVAVAHFELTAATLTTRKKEIQLVVLAAARGELRTTASGAANSDGSDAYADREARAAERQRLKDRLAGPDGGLPWDALPIGNPDEDEENRAKALLVVGEYFTDYREARGQRLYDACMGKDTPDNGKRKTKSNKGKFSTLHIVFLQKPGCSHENRGFVGAELGIKTSGQ
jgi:hypothetical protein